MSGRNKFGALTGEVAAKRRARIEAEKKRLRGEMALHESHTARKPTQAATGAKPRKRRAKSPARA